MIGEVDATTVFETACAVCEEEFKVSSTTLMSETCKCPSCNISLRIILGGQSEWGPLVYTAELGGAGDDVDEGDDLVLRSEYVNDLIARGQVDISLTEEGILAYLKERHLGAGVGTSICCELVGVLLGEGQISVKSISEATGIPSSTIYALNKTNKNLGPTALQMFREARISYRMAVTVSPFKPSTQMQVIYSFLQREISAAEVGARCKLLDGGKGSQALSAAERLSELAQDYTGFDLKVLPTSDSSGKIEISYYSLDTLEDCLLKLGLPESILEEL